MRCFQVFAFLSVIAMAFAGLEETLQRLGTQQSLQRSLSWLESQRRPTWGWGSDTPRAVLALQLANHSWLSPDNLRAHLTVKQLELETVLALLSRNHDNPLRAGRVAQFVNALVSVCKDPKSFHGHDLISILEHLDISHPFEYSYATMAICNSRHHLRKKQIRRLVSVLESSDTVHTHDTLGMAVLAMACIIKEHRNRNLLSYLEKPIHRLKKLQHEDGSFGNLYTTALSTQALMAMNELGEDWNVSNALKFMLSQQQEDGSFGNMMATAFVLPILAGTTYYHVPNTSCHQATAIELADAPAPAPSVGDMTTKPETIEKQQTITVKYSLWVGTNVTESYTITLTVPQNTSFYEVMKRAAEEDEKFEFSATLWPTGHYVHTLAGYPEDRVENNYWLLALNNNSGDKPLFVDMGVDDLYPQDNDHIVFWYKQI